MSKHAVLIVSPPLEVAYNAISLLGVNDPGPPRGGSVTTQRCTAVWPGVRCKVRMIEGGTAQVTVSVNPDRALGKKIMRSLAMEKANEYGSLPNENYFQAVVEHDTVWKSEDWDDDRRREVFNIVMSKPA